jgi:hypothetical protein
MSGGVYAECAALSRGRVPVAARMARTKTWRITKLAGASQGRVRSASRPIPRFAEVSERSDDSAFQADPIENHSQHGGAL